MAEDDLTWLKHFDFTYHEFRQRALEWFAVEVGPADTGEQCDVRVEPLQDRLPAAGAGAKQDRPLAGLDQVDQKAVRRCQVASAELFHSLIKAARCARRGRRQRPASGLGEAPAGRASNAALPVLLAPTNEHPGSSPAGPDLVSRVIQVPGERSTGASLGRPPTFFASKGSGGPGGCTMSTLDCGR